MDEKLIIDASRVDPEGEELEGEVGCVDLDEEFVKPFGGVRYRLTAQVFGTDYEGRFDEARTRSFYHTHYRFIQTRDEYFDHPFPDMLGQWKVCGLGLDESVLRKLYRDNAIRVFGL